MGHWCDEEFKLYSKTNDYFAICDLYQLYSICEWPMVFSVKIENQGYLTGCLIYVHWHRMNDRASVLHDMFWHTLEKIMKTKSENATLEVTTTSEFCLGCPKTITYYNKHMEEQYSIAAEEVGNHPLGSDSNIMELNYDYEENDVPDDDPIFYRYSYNYTTNDKMLVEKIPFSKLLSEDCNMDSNGDEEV